jgi:hypothetical protein
LKSAYIATPVYLGKLRHALPANLGKRLSIPAQTVETATQAVSSMSVFLLALPWGNPGVANHTFSMQALSAQMGSQLENLAAIQHELYVVSPLLMLVSVTGLLVALIGAPLFVAPGHTAKKVAHRH